MIFAPAKTEVPCPAILPAQKTEGRICGWLCGVAGLVLLAILAYPALDRFLSGRNDFAQLYAGARLSGTPGLYEPAASKKVHMEVLGVYLESVYYSRPPFYAFLLRPLGRLPYLTAYWLFQTLSFGALACFLWIWAPRCRELPVFACLCIPVLANFLTGQDLAFPLLAFALAIEAMRRGCDFTAGLLLALCATKVHLFGLVPLALLMQRRWRVLGGGAVGGTVLFSVSFLSDGWNWPLRYLALLSNPEIHPGPDHMPTLRGLIYAVIGGESKIMLLLLSSIVVLVFLWVAWQSSLEFGLAFALVGGLLIGYHAYLQDCLILLMTFVLVLQHSRFAPLRGAVALAISPPVYFCLLLGSPWNAVVPVVLMLTLALAAFSPDVQFRPPAAARGVAIA